MSVYLSPIGGAGAQFFNNDGIPLSGGKLYSYLAGTTTPQATYTTSIGNVAHSNPIVLDSAGRIPAGGEIWFADQVTYKLVLETSNNALIATWDNLSGINDVVASQIPYTPGGANAVTTTVQAKLRQTITVEDFGAVGDGVVNDTTAFVNAFTYLQVLNGGRITGTSGKNYAIQATISGTLFTLTSCNNIDIDFRQSKITDTRTYTGTQTATLFNFVTCTNIFFGANIQSQESVTVSPVSIVQRGLTHIQLNQGGSQLYLDLNIVGGYLGVQPTKLYNDPASYQFNGISGRIKAKGLYYPYNSQFSGNNVDLILELENVNRSFFIYGVNHNKFRLYTKNSQGTALIKSYNGYGCQNVDVDWTDVDSTINQSSAPRLGIEWGDSTAAIHSDIRINVNWKNPAASPWGNSINFAKYLDGGATPDTTGRGHRLYAFKLTGFSNNTGTAVGHVIWDAGAFSTSGTPDLMTGYEIGPFVALGSSNSMSWGMTALGVATFNSVTTEHNIYTSNGTTGQVLFNNCEAENFTGATNSTDQHTYLYCRILSNPPVGLQAYTQNQTLINTNIFNRGFATGQTTKRASVAKFGNLTSAQNIFKVVPGFNGAMYMLTYYLTADNGDTIQATRDETFGIKYFSATIDGSGTWIQQVATSDMVVEKTQGTASVLTVSLVNGTAAGGFIAVAATNYNGANAIGSFELTVVNGYSQTIVNPV